MLTSQSTLFERTLYSERLSLAPLTLADAVDLLPLWSEAETMHYLHVKPLERITDIEEMIQTLEDDRYAIRFAIRLKETQTLIGTFGINDWTQKGIEIGYELKACYRRQGYMREVLLCVLPFLWSVTDVALYAKIDTANIPSQKLLTSLNFKRIFQSWEFNAQLDKNIHISYFFLEKEEFLIEF